MLPKRDYYDVLRVSRDANGGELKRAYHAQAKTCHPDLNQDDPENAAACFREVRRAYEVLSDPARRLVYDTIGDEGLLGEGLAEGAGFAEFHDILNQFGMGDLFGEVFRDRAPSGAAAPTPRRGHDAHMGLTLSFEEAAFGATRTLRVPHHAPCDSCMGDGTLEELSARPCPRCEGKGKISHKQGIFNVSQSCPQCDGAGELDDDVCVCCGGQGSVTTYRALTLRIPAGIDTDARLRVKGEGELGQHGGERGDLLVAIEVEPSPVFEREGSTLRVYSELSFIDAALGCEIRVPTLQGERTLRIPAGTQYGATFTLTGEGLPEQGGAGVGPLVVQLKLITPVLDEAGLELLRKLSSTQPPHRAQSGRDGVTD